MKEIKSGKKAPAHINAASASNIIDRYTLFCCILINDERMVL
jgi:hypothetical protein